MEKMYTHKNPMFFLVQRQLSPDAWLTQWLQLRSSVSTKKHSSCLCLRIFLALAGKINRMDVNNQLIVNCSDS